MLEQFVDFVRTAPGVYQLRRERTRKRFFASRWGLWGSYDSMAHAREQSRDSDGSTYDHPDMVDINLDYFSEFHLFDYPIMNWLNRLVVGDGLRTVVDFGGHVGVKFYAYRERMRLPDDLTWCVVDVEAMVERGAARAAQVGESRIDFRSNIEEAPAADILFCSGSLMYVDDEIDQIVARMARKPPYLLINKLAVLPDREVFSLEGFGRCVVPYRVFRGPDFERLVSGLGYELLDQWVIEDRTHTIPFVPGAEQIKSIGQVWRARSSE